MDYSLTKYNYADMMIPNEFGEEVPRDQCPPKGAPRLPSNFVQSAKVMLGPRPKKCLSQNHSSMAMIIHSTTDEQCQVLWTRHVRQDILFDVVKLLCEL